VERDGVELGGPDSAGVIVALHEVGVLLVVILISACP
jgi:hypothetical protein